MWGLSSRRTAYLSFCTKDSVDSFAGMANPIIPGPLEPGMNVVDVGFGDGFDWLAAATLMGPTGRVIGVDMTPEMLRRAQAAATLVGLDNVEFREGLAEDLPVDDGWADVVISNGVINLVSDRSRALSDINRVLKSGGVFQIAESPTENPSQRAPRATSTSGLHESQVA